MISSVSLAFQKVKRPLSSNDRHFIEFCPDQRYISLGKDRCLSFFLWCCNSSSHINLFTRIAQTILSKPLYDSLITNARGFTFIMILNETLSLGLSFSVQRMHQQKTTERKCAAKNQIEHIDETARWETTARIEYITPLGFLSFELALIHFCILP